jgi:RND superfamily putative drug exporter
MGVLTWMFVDGHGSGLMNYTPQPLMAPMIGMIIAIIWGLSTDYEVFLVSRMVEARERGMSTAEAIRIGTATTGRLITGAALILAVVAGAFAFSDLVMMKYLAFGLLIALLLDATVIRMFLVPAVMKLLGDDCWWAPKWMKRLQERLGLGETELPDERKRPTVRDKEEALVGAGAPVPPRPQPPHDPSHPAAEGSSRPGAATTRIQTAPGRGAGPSVAGTTRMRTPHTAPADEPQTTRMPAAGTGKPRNPVNNTNPAPQRKRAAPPPPVREDREIESWLGELRGNGPAGSRPAPSPRPQPGAEPTTAIPAQPPRRSRHASTDAEPTTAIPAQPQQDPEMTEKLPAQEAEEEGRRRGTNGGVSAAELLRREGRGR